MSLKFNSSSQHQRNDSAPNKDQTQESHDGHQRSDGVGSATNCGNVGGKAPARKAKKNMKATSILSHGIVLIDCIFRARIEVMFVLQRVHIQNVQHLHLSGADMNDPGEDDVIEEEEEEV